MSQSHTSIPTHYTSQCGDKNIQTEHRSSEKWNLSEYGVVIRTRWAGMRISETFGLLYFLTQPGSNGSTQENV